MTECSNLNYEGMYAAMCAKCADLEVKLGDLEEILDDVKKENLVLRGQMEIVRLFLGG